MLPEGKNVTRQLNLWAYSNPALLLLGIGFLLILPAFWGGITDLIGRWDRQEEYSHGYMIPFVSAYLIWQRRDFLNRIEFKPTWVPLGFVVVGLFVAVIGEISALYILIHFSLILIILAMAWSLMGWNAFKYVLIPLLLLVFAIPLPYFMEAVLTAKLQLISSSLGVGVIRLFGIPVFLEGNIIDLGGYQLQVVEACSGLRYLYPLMGVGFIVAYLYQVSLWKRVVVFLSTIPITIIMNSFRVGVVGILVEYWGIDMAEGFLHDFEGWIIFVACLAILIAEMWLLNRLSKNPLSLKQVFVLPGLDEVESDAVTHHVRPLSTPFLVIIGLVVIAFFVVNFVDQREEVFPQRQSLVTFPIAFDQWQGKQDKLLPSIEQFLNVTDYVLNDYTSDNKLPINLYVAYYKSQRKGLAPHSPRVCIPGGGWDISEIKQVKIHLATGNALPLNRVVIQNGNNKQLVYYWFKQRGRDIASEYWMKWYLLTDSLSMSRTDGSLVRLTTPIMPNEKESDAENRLNGFLSTVNPMLEDYVPI
jgi:exosortase D (VPLPA-CTERM-specific)